MSGFEELENRINELLKSSEAFEAENLSLKGELGEKDKKIAELEVNLAGVEKEKGKVKGRVNTLLTRLDGLIESFPGDG